MATVKAAMGLGRGVLASGAALAVLLAGLAPARAQLAPPPPGQRPSVASVLQSARECYTRGDYEAAATFYQQVKASAAELTPAERDDLEQQIRRNDIALRGRRAGRAQIHQADEALRRGQVPQARSLLKALETNPYLAAADKQAVARLNERVRSGGSAPAAPLAGQAMTMPAPPGKLPPNADAKTALAAARAALQRGELKDAEEMAQYAKQLDGSWMHLPWSDTPAKVLRDVEVARARQAAEAKQAAAKLQAAEAKSRAESSSPFQSVKNFLGMKSTPAKAAAGASGPDQSVTLPPPPAPVGSGFNSNAVVGGPSAPPPDRRDAAARARDTARARQLLDEGYQSLQKNDLARARQLAEEARFLRPQLDSWERTPDRLLADVRARSERITPASFAQAPKDTVPPPPAPSPVLPMPVPPMPVPALPVEKERQRATEQARQLIAEGRKALEKNELEKARRLGEQAQALRPDLKWHEDNPERLLRDVERRAPIRPRGLAATPRPGLAPDAHAQLKAARELFNQGKLDEAEKSCARAAATPGAHWGLFDRDNPDKLRGDIQRGRTRGDREEATRLLAEARRQYNLNHLKEAKALAARAKQKHGPYSLLDLGDRPDTLLADIEMAEMKQRTVAVPPGEPAIPPPPSPLAQRPAPPKGPAVRPAPMPGPLAQGQPAPPGLGTAPPAAPTPNPADTNGLLARQRIRSLLQEARALQQQNRLLEARAKLMEAQGAWRDAITLGVRFGPDDEAPGRALGDLSAACGRRVQALLAHADEMASQGAANPRHLDDAVRDLAQARQLAKAFRQDLRPIEEKTAWVQRLQDALAQGVRPVAPLPAGPVAQGQPAPMPVGPGKLDGHHLLDDARRELRAGKLDVARRMAEAAMEPAYGVQAEAAALIHSIDDEERNQKILASNRNADALRDAFNHHDYPQAALLFRSVDLRQLNEERRNRLREILGTPEMEAALNGGRPAPAAPGRATATDLAQGPPALGAAPAAPDPLEQYKAREQILFQKFREEGLSVRARSLQMSKDGSTVEATELLRDYIDRLNASQMDPEHVALLRRPAEDRLQQFSTLQAQESIDAERIAVKMGMNKEGRRAENLHRKQQDVAELMRRYNDLFKEAKYKDCLVLLAQAKDIDPENASVNYAWQLTKIRARLQRSAEMKEVKEGEFLEWLDHDQGPNVDLSHPLAFDKETVERIRQRKALGESGFSFGLHDEKERQIEQKLLEPTTVGFSNTPLQKVIEELRALHNLNIVADKAALDQESMSLDSPLSLTVSGISLKSALNLLLKQANLTYTIKDQVLLVTTQGNAQGMYKQVIYPVTDLVVPVDNHAPPVVSDLNHTLEQFNASQMAGPRGVTPYVPQGGLVQGNPVSMQDALNGSPNNSFASSPAGNGQPTVTVRNADHTIQENLVKLITTTIAPESWSDMGGKGTIQFYPLGMGLVVNQTQDIQEQVADLLAALRKLQDLEVAIEIRLISVSESFFERMGVNFGLNIVTPTSSVEQLLTTGNFQPFPFVNRFTPAKFGPVGLTPAGTFTPDLNIPIKATSFDFTTPPFGGYTGTPGADGGLALGLAFLSDIQVYMMLELAQGDRRTQTMQAPRVTVFNGQSAFISVNTFQFFLIGVNINTAADQIFFTPQNQAVPLGVNVFVTPVVTADRRFVRLSLAPTLTNMSNANVPLIPVQIPVPQVFNDNFVNPQPVIFQMFFQQPTIETINVNTTVLVPDGGTVLLGGLKTMSEGRNEFGPPFLSKIPYLSRLFKNTAYGREGNSLMIMVTPRIIINEEEEQIFLGQLPPLPRP